MEISIAIGADHRGFKLKEFLKQQHSCAGHTIAWQDCGACDDQRSDYPIFAHLVCQQMLTDHIMYGVLLCGTGVGMAIAANRFEGIYAAVAWNIDIARLAREDDNCNVLVIPADFCDEQLAWRMVEVWLASKFKEGRYAERIGLIDVE